MIYQQNLQLQFMDLSIIVPIYNVEKYVRTCIESIFKQSLDEKRFEVIIINDGTTDNSMEVIADIINQHSNIKIINQENQGLSVARNNGIAIAKGEYLLMPDSDDLLIENSVKPLLEKALSEKADIIVADFIQMNDKELDNLQLPTIIKQNENIEYHNISGIDLINKDFCRFYWRSIYRKEFLTENHISFIPGIFAQDMPFTNYCFLKANHCIRTTLLLYIYRRGHYSSSSRYSFKRANDTSIAIKEIWNLSKSLDSSSSIHYKQQDLVFFLFYEHLCAIAYGHLKNFSEIKQVLTYLKKQIPNPKFKHGKRQQMWSFLYNKLPTTIFALIICTKQSLMKKFGNSKNS